MRLLCSTPHVDAPVRECRRRIAAHERRRHRNGYAPWTVVIRAEGRIVGWGGLYNDPFQPGWSVGVTVMPASTHASTLDFGVLYSATEIAEELFIFPHGVCGGLCARKSESVVAP